MAHPIAVTDSTFPEEVLQSKLPVLVDFWATWCSPCKMIAPIVEDLANEYEGKVKITKVDIDANPVSPGQFGVMSVPTLMLFANGTAVERIVGYQPKAALKKKIEAALAPAI